MSARPSDVLRLTLLALAFPLELACRRQSIVDIPMWRVQTDATGREFRVVRLPFEEAYYDMSTHAIMRRVLDRNEDKISDKIINYEGLGGARTEETDTDFDGEVDRWETFAHDGKRVRAATARRGGRPDRMATYDRAGLLARVDVDTDLDGAFDEVRVYEAGKFVEKQLDMDNNGRPDRFQDFRKGFLEVERFDTDEDGAPDLEMTYAKDGSLIKVTRNPLKNLKVEIPR